MAEKQPIKELTYRLTDDDYIAFNRYHIQHTKSGRSLVNKTRISYVTIALGVAALFFIFPFATKLRIIISVICAGVAAYGIIFAEKKVLKANEKAIRSGSMDISRVREPDNKVTFKGKSFSVEAGSSISEFEYKQIWKIDYTPEGLYIWVSQNQAMSIPMHAFARRSDGHDLYDWLVQQCEK